MKFVISYVDEFRYRKVFQRVSKPHTVVHVRSMDFPNLVVHTLVAISLCFVDGHCKSESHRKLSRVGIIGMRGNSTSSPLNFPFKIVASMILFIIFFTGHLVTDHLVT
jgi:nicotinamide riboside transporter PnuC